MNIKTATQVLTDAQALAESTLAIIASGEMTEAQRTEVSSNLQAVRRMRQDAEVMRELETAAKAGIKLPETPSTRNARPEEFASFGEFLIAAVEARTGGQRDPRLVKFDEPAEPGDPSRKERKVLAGTTGASGGFLIPETFVNDLQSVMIEQMPILSRVTPIPMASRTITLPAVDYTQALPEGEPRQFGGVQAFYQEEGAESEDSEPKFRQHTLTARELVIYTRANNSLLADSAQSLEAFLNSNMGMVGALNWKIAYKLFRGTGAGQPLGVLNSPATIFVVRENYGTITYTDLINMENVALPSARLAWYAGLNTRSALRALKDAAGNLIYSDPVASLPSTLLGYPIYFVEQLPSKGSEGDIVLADMSYVLFGDRQAPTMDVSTEAEFRNNRTAYRLIHRHDAGPWMNAPMTLSDTSTQVSPFVALDNATTPS